VLAVLRATAATRAAGVIARGFYVAAFFLLAASGTVWQLCRVGIAGQEFDDDMLTQLGISRGTILPEAAGLAIVGAIFQLLRAPGPSCRGRTGSCF